MTVENPEARYACISMDPAYIPVQIQNRSLCMQDDAASVIHELSTR